MAVPVGTPVLVLEGNPAGMLLVVAARAGPPDIEQADACAGQYGSGGGSGDDSRP